MIRKRLVANGKNKSIWPDGVGGEILKQCGEAMMQRLTTLLDITINNAAIASDRKAAMVVAIYKGRKSIDSDNLQTGQLKLSGTSHRWIRTNG
jgi:hypothetical protein